MSVKHLVFVLSSLLILCSAASSQTAFCPRIAGHTMDVKLDPETGPITGTNTTGHEASERWFHLRFPGEDLGADMIKVYSSRRLIWLPRAMEVFTLFGG